MPEPSKPLEKVIQVVTELEPVLEVVDMEEEVGLVLLQVRLNVT
jgi:hypothetical protein